MNSDVNGDYAGLRLLAALCFAIEFGFVYAAEHAPWWGEEPSSTDDIVLFLVASLPVVGCWWLLGIGKSRGLPPRMFAGWVKWGAFGGAAVAGLSIGGVHAQAAVMLLGYFLQWFAVIGLAFALFRASRR